MRGAIKWLGLLPIIGAATIIILFSLMLLSCFILGLEYALLGTTNWNEYTQGNYRLGVQCLYLSMLSSTIIVYLVDRRD